MGNEQRLNEENDRQGKPVLFAAGTNPLLPIRRHGTWVQV
jgi:hypothetical protein